MITTEELLEKKRALMDDAIAISGAIQLIDQLLGSEVPQET